MRFLDGDDNITLRRRGLGAAIRRRVRRGRRHGQGALRRGAGARRRYHLPLAAEATVVTRVEFLRDAGADGALRRGVRGRAEGRRPGKRADGLLDAASTASLHGQPHPGSCGSRSTPSHAPSRADRPRRLEPPSPNANQSEPARHAGGASERRCGRFRALDRPSGIGGIEAVTTPRASGASCAERARGREACATAPVRLLRNGEPTITADNPARRERRHAREHVRRPSTNVRSCKGAPAAPLRRSSSTCARRWSAQRHRDAVAQTRSRHWRSSSSCSVFSTPASPSWRGDGHPDLALSPPSRLSGGLRRAERSRDLPLLGLILVARHPPSTTPSSWASTRLTLSEEGKSPTQAAPRRGDCACWSRAYGRRRRPRRRIPAGVQDPPGVVGQIIVAIPLRGGRGARGLAVRELPRAADPLPHAPRGGRSAAKARAACGARPW